MNICLCTKDRHLAHRLSLLPKPYTLTDLRHAALLIWDADSCERPVSSLPILRITGGEETDATCFATLPRPFSTEQLIHHMEKAASLFDFPALSPTEQKLFFALLDAGEEGADRARLIRAVWGEGATEDLLSVYICYLRKKIEHDGKKRIFSLRGKGYLYRAASSDR